MGTLMKFPIDERLKQLTETETSTQWQPPQRDEFQDPVLISFEDIALSRVIDDQLEEFYSPTTPSNVLTRVFSRFRRRD